ncbi:MAG: 4Fe-4S binding protein [Alphaproteobacteria bacterium]|nr:4Fe-4S binding protein [Alphaproteobacteria bacterium]
MILVSVVIGPARAQGGGPDLSARLTPAIIQEIFPGATRVGSAEGSPPAAAVYIDAEVAGYIFSTLDVVAAVGYTTTPFDVIGGVTNDGTVTGMKVVYHKETIFGRGVSEQSLFDYLTNIAGYLLYSRNKKIQGPDVVSGGTITARAMRNAVFDSARLVLRARTNRLVVTAPTLDVDGFRPLSWPQLLDNGAVAHLAISNDEVAQAFVQLGAQPPKEMGPAGQQFLDLYATLVTPKGIGQNLFGNRYYPTYMKGIPAGAQALFVGSAGAYSFRGLNFHKKALDNVFDRLQIVQDDRVITFRKPDHKRVGRIVDAAKVDVRDSSIFLIPADSGFDPLRPWRLDLNVEGQGADGPQMAVFSLLYELPAQFILLPPPEPLPGWLEPWWDGRINVAILAAILIALTLTVIFQNALTRRRRLHRVVRNTFLVVILGWLGLIAGGQLTIVNVINYVRAPFDSLPFEFYIRDPLLVMIVVYAAVSAIILGRGLFCGWLCPFGAMQELLYKVGRLARLPTVTVGPRTDRLLRPVKYVALTILIALAFYSGDIARVAAEVEPFKTAVISKFDRSLPYVAYAILILGTGLFVERAFCRYLCPLGATLAVLGRLRLSDRLVRRLECGSPCNLCSRACPVKAIEPSGKINMNECLRCLDCQVEYHDPHRCPPLAQTRKAREQLGAFAQLKPTSA